MECRFSWLPGLLEGSQGEVGDEGQWPSSDLEGAPRGAARWSIGSIHSRRSSTQLDSERDLTGFHPSVYMDGLWMVYDIAFYKTRFCSISFKQKRENFLTVVGVWHRQAISSVAAVMFAMPWYGSTQDGQPTSILQNVVPQVTGSLT